MRTPVGRWFSHCTLLLEGVLGSFGVSSRATGPAILPTLADLAMGSHIPAFHMKECVGRLSEVWCRYVVCLSDSGYDRSEVVWSFT